MTEGAILQKIDMARNLYSRSVLSDKRQSDARYYHCAVLFALDIHERPRELQWTSERRLDNQLKQPSNSKLGLIAKRIPRVGAFATTQ